MNEENKNVIADGGRLRNMALICMDDIYRDFFAKFGIIHISILPLFILIKYKNIRYCNVC